MNLKQKQIAEKLCGPDDDDVEENNASFYRAFDNDVQPGPSSASQVQVEGKRLKKIKVLYFKVEHWTNDNSRIQQAKVRHSPDKTILV